MYIINMKLHRDKVISIVKGKDLVGVYIKAPKNYWFTSRDDGMEVDIPQGQELLLAEMSPKKADRIIKLWNSK